jgi:hypothetical protein
VPLRGGRAPAAPSTGPPRVATQAQTICAQGLGLMTSIAAARYEVWLAGCERDVSFERMLGAAASAILWDRR